MKNLFLRLVFFCVGGVFLFFSPWIALVLGGLLFSIVFPFPIEVFLLALGFELLSGVPAGYVLLPLTGAYIVQYILRDRIDTDSFAAKTLLFSISIICFVLIRSLFLVLFFGYSLEGVFRSLFSF